MARAIAKLSPAKVKNASKPGVYGDAAGLYLNGPVVSHAAATRPPQSPEHRIRCSTSGHGAAPRQVTDREGAFAAAARRQDP